jgi:hypothetical protein
VIPARLALLKAQSRLAERAEDLGAHIDGSEAPETLERYCLVIRTLAAIVPPSTSEDARGLLTSEELSERLGVSRRTLRRRRKAGELQPVTPGGRGRSAMWSAGSGQ